MGAGRRRRHRSRPCRAWGLRRGDRAGDLGAETDADPPSRPTMRSELALTLLLATAACGGERSYKVGVLSRGGAVFNGADIAAREVNGKDGIKGVPLRVQLADTTAAATRGADSSKVADQLAKDSAVRF